MVATATTNGHALDSFSAGQRYVAAGISVIPTAENKRPAGWLLPIDPETDKPTWKPFQERLPTPAELDQWWGRSVKGGIAIVHGAVSGNLECLDFDKRADETFPRFLQIVTEYSPDLYSRLSITRTPRPGYHVRYRCEAPVEGNQKLAQFVNDKGVADVLVETRGEGGYALGPGTEARFHELNKTYDHIDGPSPFEPETITADERAFLLATCRSFDEVGEEQSPERERQNSGDTKYEVTPWDDFIARTNWNTVLGDRGWKCVVEKGGLQYWKHPDAEGEWSATVGYKGGDLIHNFSSRSGLPQNKSCSRYAAVVFLDYSGDFRRAADEMLRAGYGRLKPRAKNQQQDYSHQSDQPEKPRRPVSKFTLRTLCEQHPKLRPVVIDGLLRKGETLNVISATKIGKSWLVIYIAVCVVLGIPIFGIFQTTKGRVLLIDNELHPETIASRVKTVLYAMGVNFDDVAEDLDIWSLRGNLLTLDGIRQEIDTLEPDTYVLSIIDAKYRTIGDDEDENSNGDQTRYYNTVDRIALDSGSAFGLVSHSTKGLQSEKRVTDVGAGGGGQSRACDCHLVLREHEEENCIVLDAAVRSFPPVTPIVLRWNFPLWEVDEMLDPTQLKGRKSAAEEKQDRQDQEAQGLVLDKAAAWISRPQLKTATGLGYGRLDRAIAKLIDANYLESEEREREAKTGPKTATFYRKTINARA